CHEFRALFRTEDSFLASRGFGKLAMEPCKTSRSLNQNVVDGNRNPDRIGRRRRRRLKSWRDSSTSSFYLTSLRRLRRPRPLAKVARFVIDAPSPELLQTSADCYYSGSLPIISFRRMVDEDSCLVATW